MTEELFFDNQHVLENNRVRLTPLSLDDLPVLEPIAFHPEIWRLGSNVLQERAHLEAYVKTALAEKQKKVSYPFLIFDKQSNKVAGCTRYGNISFPNKRLEIGWTWLHPEFHGSGLNKACKFSLLRFAFEDLGFNRVEIKTDVLNLQSRKAIIKIGGKEEGIFRKHQVVADGRIRDTIYFSIINEEWSEIRSRIFADF